MKCIFYIIMTSFLVLSCSRGEKQVVIAEVKKEVRNDILQQMEASRQCWNKGDLEGYMQVYWASDSMCFMGLNTITYGWELTLNRYKKGYPSAAHRGELSYEFMDFNQLSDDCVLVIGRFHLERKMGNSEGNFSLIWKNINQEWKIILDHT